MRPDSPEASRPDGLPGDPAAASLDGVPATARERLLEAIASLREQGPLRIDAMKHQRTPRASAVLILVGVLDDVEAVSDAAQEGPAADLDLLLIQRAATLRAHPGQVAFPGGRLDPEDGDPEDPDDVLELPGGPVPAAFVRAALREAQEETGLDPDGVEVLGALPKAPVPVSGHDVTPVIAWWSRPTAVDVVDHAESSLVFRVPLLDLVDPRRRHTAQVTREGANRPTLRHRSPAFRIPRHVTDPVGGTDEVVVWGFTGILLDRVLSAAGWAQPWDRNDVRPAPLG